MNNKTAAEALLKQIEFLYSKYSEELRATTQPYYLAKVKKNVKSYLYEPEDVLVRESLLEHVGSLPMVATTFYPYLDDPSVDLGETLIMLAIHDIGELITGDEITFTKKASGKKAEYDAALSLLHPSYHKLYDDVETQSSPAAKFAKAVDKITPDILDYLTPAEITIRRYKHFVGVEPERILTVMLKHKRPYMVWSPFMTDFHILLYKKLAIKLGVPSID